MLLVFDSIGRYYKNTNVYILEGFNYMAEQFFSRVQLIAVTQKIVRKVLTSVLHRVWILCSTAWIDVKINFNL